MCVRYILARGTTLPDRDKVIAYHMLTSMKNNTFPLISTIILPIVFRGTGLNVGCDLLKYVYGIKIYQKK